MNKEKIKQLNSKFSNELDHALKIVLPELTEAFINIYGAKHSAYIKSIISNIKWIYFIPERDLELLVTYYKKLNFTNKYIIKSYQCHFRDLEMKYNNLPSNELLSIKFIYRHYLAKSDLPETHLIAHNISDVMAGDVPLFTPIMTDNKEIENLILLPIYTITLNQIIHEINHTIIMDTVAYTKDEIITVNLFETKESEELINDYIAFLVLEEFFRLGGQVPHSLKRFPMYSEYRENAYIVEDYFANLQPLLLECLITKKFRLFKHIVGEANHTSVCEIMSYLFEFGPDPEIETELGNLITSMKSRLDSYNHPNYISYLTNLEHIGCKIRRLK